MSEAIREAFKPFIAVSSPELIPQEPKAGEIRQCRIRVGASDWRMVMHVAGQCPNIAVVQFEENFEQGEPASLSLILDIDTTAATLGETGETEASNRAESAIMEQAWAIHSQLMALLPGGPNLADVIAAQEVEGEPTVHMYPASIMHYKFSLTHERLGELLALYLEELNYQRRSLTSHLSSYKRKGTVDSEAAREAATNLEGVKAELLFLNQGTRAILDYLQSIYDTASEIESASDFNSAVAQVAASQVLYLPSLMPFLQLLGVETSWIRHLSAALEVNMAVEA